MRYSRPTPLVHVQLSPKTVHSSTVHPDLWMGEANCLIGPFDSRTVAERFVDHTLDLGQLEALSYRIVLDEDRWYVDTRPTLEAYGHASG